MPPWSSPTWKASGDTVSVSQFPPQYKTLLIARTRGAVFPLVERNDTQIVERVGNTEAVPNLTAERQALAQPDLRERILLAPTGRLVYVGITTKEVTFKHPIFHKPEGTLLCSRNALPKDFTRIIGLIETGKIDTRPWITHRTGFDNLASDFESFTKPETGVIKAIVDVA